MELLKPLKGHKSRPPLRPDSHPNLPVTYKQSAAHTPYLTATGVFCIVSTVIQRTHRSFESLQCKVNTRCDRFTGPAQSKEGGLD